MDARRLRDAVRHAGRADERRLVGPAAHDDGCRRRSTRCRAGCTRPASRSTAASRSFASAVQRRPRRTGPAWPVCEDPRVGGQVLDPAGGPGREVAVASTRSAPSRTRPPPAGRARRGRGLRHGVALHARVAEHDVEAGRDHVRRVRHDESEPLAEHRLEQLPCRNSTFSTPFRAQLNSANSSARSLMSVAITRSACAAISSAWDAVAGADVERRGGRAGAPSARRAGRTAGARPRRDRRRRRSAGRWRSAAGRAARAGRRG